MAVMTPPLVGRDDDPYGLDFLLGWQLDSDGNPMDITVQRVWQDVQTDPGMELLSSWVDAPGSPTYGTAEYFAVFANYEINYPVGTPVRFKTTASGSTWLYSHVESYDAASSPDRVYVAHDNLATGLNSVQIAADYIIETSRYSLLGEDLLSIRCFDGAAGGVVVQVRNTSLANPATMIREIMRNTKWGLGQTVNEASFSQAVADFAAAGLGEAVDGVIGHDRNQRHARDVLRDLCSMRGARLTRNASSGEWELAVDGPGLTSSWIAAPGIPTYGTTEYFTVSADYQINYPAGMPIRFKTTAGGSTWFYSHVESYDSASSPDRVYVADDNLGAGLNSVQIAGPAVTLGFSDGQWNNVTRVRSIRRRSLSEAVRTLRFRFGVLGRVAARDGLPGSVSLVPGTYRYFVDAECLDIGKTVESTNLFIQAAPIARRVAYYQAQNLRASDLSIELDGGQELRLLRAGDLVRFISPTHGLDGTFRVWRTAKRLHEVSVLLRGYDAATFTFDASKVGDTIDDAERAENDGGAVVGTNLLANPDFSAGIRKEGIDSAMLPGWDIQDGSTAFLTSVTTTSDARTISNASYLTVVTSGTAFPTNSPVLYAGDGGAFGLSVDQVGRQLMASIYCDRADGWRFQVKWVDSSSITIRTDHPPLLIAGGRESQNALGWKRYFSRISAPSGAVRAFLAIALDRATGTFKFDGAQLEKMGGPIFKPSEWKRSPRWGIDPAQFQPGALTIRGTGQPEAGLVLQAPVFEELTLSGASVDSSGSLIPSGAVLHSVTGRVTQAITGASSFNVGVAGDARFATAVGLTLDTTWNVQAALTAGIHVVGDTYGANTAVRITANGSNFTGGKVRLQVIYSLVVVPTS